MTDGGNGLLEDLQPLGAYLRPEDGVPGDISTWPGVSATRSARTGSPIAIMTIGMVAVASLAARLGGVP